MAAYYNEIDRQKAATLRVLIGEGLIAPGVVDERSITEVRPADLEGFRQCHFFAGGGVWSYALRRAGWPDDRPVWTGSCPCGPFSRAGLQKGFDDPRHLWPAWLPLIGVCRPDCIFGEQSDAADAWIDLVSTDLEDRGYAFGSPDLPAAGFGGAHIRQRFYWVADTDNAEWWSERAPWHDGHWPKTGRVKSDRDAGHGRADEWLADADIDGRGQGRGGRPDRVERDPQHGGESIGLGDPQSRGRGERGDSLGARRGGHADGPSLHGRLAHPNGWKPWNGHLQRGREHRQFAQDGGAAEWLLCRDANWRPVEPGLAPLVDAYPARMALLRLLGDAIDAEVATQFVSAYLEIEP